MNKQYFDIEKQLSKLRPNPSDKFYQGMQTVPWKQHQKTAYPVRQFLVATAALVLFSMVLILTPLGAMAQETLSRFFAVQSTDTRSYEVQRDIAPTPITEASVWNPLSIAEAQAQVDFILTPPQPPPPYEFIGADVYNNGQAIMLTYVAPGDTIGRNLTFSQFPMDQFEPREIGANANVEHVMIGGYHGEYTRGWWSVVEEMPQETSGDQINIQVETQWDNDFGLHHLEWVVGDYGYRILWQETWKTDFVGKADLPGYLTLEDMIRMAETVNIE